MFSLNVTAKASTNQVDETETKVTIHLECEHQKETWSNKLTRDIDFFETTLTSWKIQSLKVWFFVGENLEKEMTFTNLKKVSFSI